MTVITVLLICFSIRGRKVSVICKLFQNELLPENIINISINKRLEFH
jgi:hypothetical protein